MRVLLNSDILHTQELIHQCLPKHLEQFARECARAGATVVFPRTVLLEVERRQLGLLDTACAQLGEAYKTLRHAGVEFTEVQASDVYAMPDLPLLFGKCGVTVEIEDPTIEDYTEAQRRACLHLAPQSPTADSDEMRDLVIWALSIRIARRDGGAILVSRDEVHTHGRGDEEAASVDLQRARHVDDALELLGIEGASGALARMLLVPLWNNLRAASLPLSDAPNVRMISNASFVQGDAGVGLARFEFSSRTADGRHLKASAEIHRSGELVTRAVITRIRVDGQKWGKKEIEVRPDLHVPLPGTSAQERLEALREAMGE